MRRLPALLVLVALLGAAMAAAPGRGPMDLPRIVFVSRRPLPPGTGVPGLGPRHRAVVTGGTLLVRERDGRVHTLVPASRFHDVADPAVSYDGTRVAFAAVTRPDSAWRIWVVRADGRGLAPVTRTDRALDVARYGVPGRPFRRYDDIDPCWLPDGRLAFSSTRYPYVAQAGGLATNLFVTLAGGGAPIRITAERDGADEACIDPASGRIVFARWWGSRYYPSEEDPTGITLDTARAVPAQHVITWHALGIDLDGEAARLAGGYPLDRTRMEAYQPVLLADGTLAGVTADTTSLEPHPGRVRLAVYPGGFAEPVEFPAAPAQMCAPSPLADGRMLVAYDPDGRGDFRIAVTTLDGRAIAMVTDRRGFADLDPVALEPRPAPSTRFTEGLGGLPRTLPPATREELERDGEFVRFDCLNVFANAPVDMPVPDAPPIARDVKIRFYVAYSRPGAAGGDSVGFLREADVTRSGAIHEDVTPGDLPMFEQLVDAHGRVLRSVSGPAHVPGFNAGRTGAGTRCVGCHIGHTAIPVADSYAMGKRFNAATSATVTATSTVPGTNPRGLVDRRTRGDWRQVAWVARGTAREAVTLTWTFPIAIDSVVVYGLRPDPEAGTDATLDGCDATLRRGGTVVRSTHFAGPISAAGSAFSLGGAIGDVLELRPSGARGRIGGAPRAGLAEVEARARIPED